MYYAICEWENEYVEYTDYSKNTTDSGTVTSAIFSQYLSAEGTLRFPTPEEPVT